MLPIWVYWENPPTTAEPPDYIKLCLETIKAHTTNLDLRILNERTINDYIDVDPCWGTIEVCHLGRKFTSISHKVDAIRAELLFSHGGLYLDADTIVFRPLEHLMFDIAEHDFTCTRLISTKQYTIPNGMLGSQPRGQVISAYRTALKESLIVPRVLGWNEIGSSLLTPIVNKNTDKVLEIPEKDVMPVSWKDKGILGRKVHLEDYVPAGAYMMALYHGAFNRKIHELPKSQLLDSTTLIGQAFKRSFNEING